MKTYEKNKMVVVEPTADMDEVIGVLAIGACFAWKLLASTPTMMRRQIERNLDAGEVALALPGQMRIKGVSKEDLSLMPTYGFWRDAETGQLMAGLAVGTQGHAMLYDSPGAEDEKIRFIEIGEVRITEVADDDGATITVIDGGKKP